MILVQLLPIAALIALVLYLVLHATRTDYSSPNAWILPALLSAAFLVFSVVAVIEDGLMQFWINHSTNLVGNQVWIDLLIGFGLAWTFLVPRAKAVGMNVWLWLLSLLLTGNIALLAMAGRVFYLERAKANPT